MRVCPKCAEICPPDAITCHACNAWLIPPKLSTAARPLPIERSQAIQNDEHTVARADE